MLIGILSVLLGIAGVVLVILSPILLPVFIIIALIVAVGKSARDERRPERDSAKDPFPKLAKTPREDERVSESAFDEGAMARISEASEGDNKHDCFFPDGESSHASSHAGGD